MKIDFSKLSIWRKIILSVAGIFYVSYLWDSINYGISLGNLLGATFVAFVIVGVLFLWIK